MQFLRVYTKLHKVHANKIIKYINYIQYALLKWTPFPGYGQFLINRPPSVEGYPCCRPFRSLGFFILILLFHCNVS